MAADCGEDSLTAKFVHKRFNRNAAEAAVPFIKINKALFYDDTVSRLAAGIPLLALTGRLSLGPAGRLSSCLATGTPFYRAPFLTLSPRGFFSSSFLLGPFPRPA